MMLAETTTVSTIVREIPADLETPTGVYLKLRGQGPSFLLESIEGGERVARYSFVGVSPRAQYIIRGNEVEQIEGERRHVIMLSPGSDPTHFLHAELRRFQLSPQEGLPRFIGGLVGYMGFESVRFFEPTLSAQVHTPSLPDAIYLLTDTVVAFDHARRSLFLIGSVLDGDPESAGRKLDEIETRIRSPLQPAAPQAMRPSSARSNFTQEAFEERVRTAQEHIAAGDIFQVVLSQRFDRESDAEPFDVYRAVRRLNPSPYMFFFDFGVVNGEPLTLVGSSPEVFARLEGRTASLRPIAGTRPRGADAAADAALEAELLADPKERAEHVMLVDLGRNDLGRVCQYGSIRVSDFLSIERYSHVMHIVSHVAGTLRPGLTAFDLVRAAFPAGTVSGAPKVRAMEIIAALEPEARGPYAGMVGYFGFDGAMDACLAIRALVAQGRTFSVQAGAGIVADSDPASEYQETVNKAKAMLRAIDTAEADS
ncbi:MAG TPA: anthranilate synthase component I [Anaerolineales bacterium]